MRDFRVITWEDTRNGHFSSFGEASALGFQRGNPLEPLRMVHGRG